MNTSLSAQFAENIRTGRPGQAIGPYVLGKGVFQVQSGFEQYFRDYEKQAVSENTFLHNTVFRVGFSEKFEMNTLLDWQSTATKEQGISRTAGGVSNSQIGLRFNVLERKGARPGLGFQYRLLLPAQSEIYRRQHLGSAVAMATNNKVFKKINFVTNWSAIWNGNEAKPHFKYTLSASFDITSKLGGFMEVYGEIDEWTAFYDGGFSYLLNKDLQLDLYGGWQGVEAYKEFFISVGVSWRWVQRQKVK